MTKLIKLRSKHIVMIAAVLVVMIMAVMIFSLSLPGEQPQPPPRVAASAYALVDLGTGTTILEHEPILMLKLGSLTKLMPILLCFQELEIGNISLDDIVTISSDAANRSGSLVGLGEGAGITLDALIYSVMMPSGNDAITAISEYICGDEATMVRRMNQAAVELGMSDTWFTDCAGTNSFDNRSTTRDLTVLVMEIMQSYPQLTDYTRDTEKTISYSRDGEGFTVTLHSTNRLLGAMHGVYGLKTGTAQNSHNAIVVLEHEGRNLMAIVLDAPSDSARWDSAKTLLEYGLGN